MVPCIHEAIHHTAYRLFIRFPATLADKRHRQQKGNA